jgi:molecular chaperone GrpE (heat shock protein)
MSELDAVLVRLTDQLTAVLTQLEVAEEQRQALGRDLLALREAQQEAVEPPSGLVEVLDRRLAQAAQAVLDVEQRLREAYELRLEAILRTIIEVSDRLDALAAGSVTESDAAELRRRLESCAGPRDRLRQVIADWGVMTVEGEGAPYDPKLHEAVRHERLPEATDAYVLQSLAPGYRRPDADHAFLRSRVVVAIPAQPVGTPDA